MTSHEGGAGGILLYDDARARTFEPFATTRPLGEMRVGALLVRERWERRMGEHAVGFIGAPHLSAFSEFDAPPAAPGSLPPLVLIVNTRAIPTELHQDTVTWYQADDEDLPVPLDAWSIGGRVAAVRYRGAIPSDVRDALEAGTLELGSLLDASLEPTEIPGVWLDEVWDILGTLSTLLNNDIPRIAAGIPGYTMLTAQSRADSGAFVTGEHHVFVEPGARIEPSVMFDTTLGPILLRRGSTVQAFTRIIGPCYIGVDSTVTADRISGSAIGDVCRVHGELSASIFLGHANKGHDGFVGHSIVGRWVNMGAGTITSNLKNTYGTVALWTPSGVRDTGQQFLGTLFGDHAKTGIGMRLTTGCVLGAGANVMDRMPPKVVAPFAWGTGEPYATFALDKFLETAGRMMSRRHVTLDERQRDFWTTVHRRATSHPLSSQG